MLRYKGKLISAKNYRLMMARQEVGKQNKKTDENSENIGNEMKIGSENNGMDSDVLSNENNGNNTEVNSNFEDVEENTEEEEDAEFDMAVQGCRIIDVEFFKKRLYCSYKEKLPFETIKENS